MEPRRIKSSYSGKCRTCGLPFAIGADILFDADAPIHYRAWHATCARPLPADAEPARAPQQPPVGQRYDPPSQRPRSPDQRIDPNRLLEALGAPALTPPGESQGQPPTAGPAPSKLPPNEPDPNDPFVRESQLAEARRDLVALVESAKRAARQGDEALSVRINNLASSNSTILSTLSDSIRALDAKLTALERTAGGDRTVTIVRPDLPPVQLGAQHHNFELLLQICSARNADGSRLNAWITGPAGSGKTTAAQHVARALNVPFFFNGAIRDEYHLKGFVDAQGRIVGTAFREAYSQPSVYLFDEVDASLEDATLAFNAALANAYCDFPDGRRERHKDCIIIAAANTWGTGANFDYIGRNKLDAAFLDRFVPLAWPIDPALELATAPDARWARTVQHARTEVQKRGMQHLITPRATYYGAALIAVGLPRWRVAELLLRRGMESETWERIVSTLPSGALDQ